MVKVFGWRLGLPGGGALPLVQHIRTSNVCTANAYFFRKLGGRFSLSALQWKKCRPRKAVILGCRLTCIFEKKSINKSAGSDSEGHNIMVCTPLKE